MSAPWRSPPARGFSLLVFAVLLIGIGLAVAVALALLPNLSDETRIDRTIDTMQDAEDDVLAYIVKNFHLPEPDTDARGTAGYGVENVGATSGALPYRSMELPAAVLDQASLPLRYAPYRNSADEADLATATSLYEPVFPDDLSDYGCPAVPASPINLLDFCVALDNAAGAAPSTDFVNTGAGHVNAAYALVSGGLENADGQGLDSSLDGVNADGDLSFEDPARGRGKGYDDIVRATPVAKLQRALSCNALLGSLELLVETAEDSRNLAFAIGIQKFQADVQVALDSFAEIMRAIGLANAIASSVGADKTAVEACAAAAACLGLCPNEDAACAAATAAAVSATAAAVAAGVDLAVGAVTLSITIATAAEVSDLNDAAKQHLCDVVDEVIAADERGGLK